MEGDDPDRTWIMPKVTARTALLTALLTLTLTGCAETPETTPSEPPAPSPSATVETTEPVDTPETAEPVEAAPFKADLKIPGEPTFDELRERWRGFVLKAIARNEAGYFEKPSDADPIGQYICNESRAGVSPENIEAIQNLPEGYEFVNTEIVDWTLMNGYAPTMPDEALPDFCGIVFPPQ